MLPRLFAWREALTVVKPDTLIRWHRNGLRLFWRWKAKPQGRSRVPAELQKLIVKMAHDNPTWGEERIVAELLLKLGIRISLRTVRRYLPPDQGARRGPDAVEFQATPLVSKEGNYPVSVKLTLRLAGDNLVCRLSLQNRSKETINRIIFPNVGVPAAADAKEALVMPRLESMGRDILPGDELVLGINGRGNRLPV